MRRPAGIDGNLRFRHVGLGRTDGGRVQRRRLERRAELRASDRLVRGRHLRTAVRADERRGPGFLAARRAWGVIVVLDDASVLLLLDGRHNDTRRARVRRRVQRQQRRHRQVAGEQRA